MTNFKPQARTLLKGSAATFALTIAMLSAPAAFAQTAETSAADETIIVTGSRIARPNVDSSSPVSVVGAAEVELRAATNAEQFLRELPGAVPSIGSAVNNGNGGSSYVNLRGLGSNRNLVLLDGVRIVPSDLNARVDLNNIPLAVIERTDILSGGATTAYGADAVAGVVNFVTKRDFAGVDLSVSNGITARGDGHTFRAEATIGANFDDGRGNAIISIGFQNTKPVFQGDRDFSVDNIDSFTGNAGGSSAAVPSVLAGYGGPLRQISPDGQSLVPFYAPYNFNPTNIFQTPFKRFNIFAAGRYEIVDNVEVYSQAMFSKNKVATIIAPGGSFFNTWEIPYSNPFLPTQIRNSICAGQGLDQATCDAAAVAVDPSDPNYATFQSQVRRRFTESGTRDTEYETSMFNLKVGARGDITENLQFDVYGSYGESDKTNRNLGWGQFSRLQQALLATNPNTCLDGSNGCVPINLFGPAGSITQPMLDFVQALDSGGVQKVTLATVSGAVSGELFTLPTATSGVGFAVGAEYREYTARQVSDSLSQIPGEVLGAGGADPDIYGKYNVKEVFGELVVPLVQGASFANELTLEAGARYSDYSTAGGEFTWKLGGQWEPMQGLRFRGNYQRGSRAPNISELFSPVQVGLDNLASDPCSGSKPLGDPTLAAICVAQGAPAAIVAAGGIADPAAGQINITFGGNPNLETEVADTWTLGAVIQPAAVPSLVITVDYYSIIVNNAITSPTVGDSLDACFVTARDATDPACTSIRRNALTGGLDGSAADTPGVPVLISNQGRLETDGIDFSARWNGDIGFANLGLSFDGNWTNRSLFKASPTSLNRECVGFYSINCPSIQPEFSFNQRTSLTFESGLTLSVLWRYLSGVDYEPAQLAADIASGGGPLEEFQSIGATSYFDLSARFEIGENLTLNLAMLNMFDKLPKVVGSSIGSTAYNSGNVYPSTYDPLGRRFSAGVRLRF